MIFNLSYARATEELKDEFKARGLIKVFDVDRLIAC